MAKIEQQAEETGHSMCPCQKEQNLPAVAPLHSWLGPTTLWAYVHLDTAGLFKEETAWFLLPQI